jgi:hypothetical protein
MIFWRLSGFKAHGKNFCELLNVERANHHSKALKEPMGMFLVSRFSLQQNTLVGFIQGLG